MSIELYHGDCLDVMPTLPDRSFDAIIADLPYGTTACKWDSVIPFEPLWVQYKRLIKKRGAIVLFGSQPFTSALVMSNVEWFKYCWYWRKPRPSGHVVAKLRPLGDIEELAVFSSGTTANCSNNNMLYNPQGLIECNKVHKRPSRYINNSGVSPGRESHKLERIIEYENYPRQVLEGFSIHNVGLFHPTQKPVALLEYLIRTYTNPGDTILDNCFGSCTTGVACIHTGRSFIGIEREAEYFEIAQRRIEHAQNEIVQLALI